MKKTFKMAIVMTLLLFMAAPCDAASNPSALVGRWVGVSGEEKGIVMELLSDGTGIATQNSIGVAITWKTEKDRFYSVVSGFAEAEDYKLQGSRLTFTKDNGKVNEYVKCNKNCKEVADEYSKAEAKKAAAVAREVMLEKVENASAEAKKEAIAVTEAKLAKIKKEFGSFTDSRDGKSYKTVKLDN